MNKPIKYFILALAFVLPTAIYLFLKGAGQNHYKLPTYIPEIDSTSGEPKMVKGDTVWRSIPPFRLLDQDSVGVTNDLVRGKIYIADFIFTRCGSICPKMSAEMTRIQDAFLNNSDILLVSHTVDAGYDTPAVLRSYAKEYDAIKGKWYFLTGNAKHIYNLAHKGYFIPLQEAEGKTDPNETFTHSERLILIDWAGHIRGFYDGTNKKDVDRLILETKILTDIMKEESLK